MPDPMFRVDVHTHTRFSPDARMSPAELVERAAALELDRVAVTDHGEIEGALEARSFDPGRVIVGEEIRCRGRTELIGLFLDERIPQGLSVEETVRRIRARGGVVYAPHPFAYLLRPRWQGVRAGSVADAVEVFNARAFVPSWNRRAARFAAEHGLPAVASSDAHRPEELGRGMTLMPSFDDAVGFLRSLREAVPMPGTPGSPFLHVLSAVWKMARLVRPLPTVADAPAGDAPAGGDATTPERP